MKEREPRAAVIAGAISLIVSLIWGFLAWRSPASTFHFAPIVAAAAGPYGAKSRTGPCPVRHAWLSAAAGLGAVLATTAVLAAANKLRGPTFWSADGAVFEAALFAVGGAATGLAYLVAGTSQQLSPDQP